mmetsp:Transcript_95721/g.268006  ORF Transcript_95721/g.268006 Transcript_95721/m.268006 type:complete len:225 (+) Transcript_95721:173-847(+)
MMRQPSARMRRLHRAPGLIGTRAPLWGMAAHGAFSSSLAPRRGRGVLVLAVAAVMALWVLPAVRPAPVAGRHGSAFVAAHLGTSRPGDRISQLGGSAWRSPAEPSFVSEPFVETRRVRWSDSDHLALPLVEETEATAHFGAGVVAFFGGLLLPVVGRLGDPMLLGFLGYMAATGELGSLQRRFDMGREFANVTDWLGLLLTEAGAGLIRAYNFAASELRGLRVA